MTSTSQSVGVLNVPTTTLTPGAGVVTPAPVPVTFYRGPSSNILSFGPAEQNPLLNITEGQWFQATALNNPPLRSWYFFSGDVVRYGSAAGDFAQGLTKLDAPILNSSPSPSVSLSTVPSSTVLPNANGDLTPNNASTMTKGAPTSTPTSKSSSDGKSGVPRGAVAGAAIGCLIAGALIAGLIFWFCWGKRKASRVRDYEASSTALMPREKGFASSAVPLGSEISGASPVAGALPLPLEDKAITSDISKISNSIKNHVQSYYQTGRVSPGLIDLDDIRALGSSQSISAGTLSTLLDNPKTREIALRFCIAWVVCSRVLPSSDSGTSLLPVEVAGCFQKMTNKNRGSPGQIPSELARWRVTTAELMHGSYVRDPFTASDGRNASVQAAANTLDNILRPFADSRMENGERRRNLEEILKRAALFAFTLFSQPSTWDFDWQAQGIKPGELCIFPALVQLSSETGQPINPPLPFSEAVVRRLDE